MRARFDYADVRSGRIVTLHADGSMLIRLARELPSVNTWNGRHWRMKHQQTQDWERTIRHALCDFLGAKDIVSVLWVMSLGGKLARHPVNICEQRMRVTITRLVPSKRRQIRDDDNLVASCKPLLDALRRIQLIRDDSRHWIDLVVAPQQVADDGEWWTHIQLDKLGGGMVHAPR